MGRQLSAKQKAHLASLPASRWKSKDSAKENLLPHILIPPRATTRAQDYTESLEDTVANQANQILVLKQSNSDYEQCNAVLMMELDTAISHVHTLELENVAITERLSDVQDLLSSQSDLIKQKNQRMNRLMRDKSVLSSQIACLKQELAQAALGLAASEKASNSATLHIQTLLQSISRLNAAASVQKAAKADLYNNLRATQMREKRAKGTIQKLRKELAAKSKWSGMKGRTYNSQYRTLAMAFSKAGCAQSRIGPLLTRVGKVFGVSIRRSMCRRTVGRVITEAGIKVLIQLGHELARAKGEAPLFLEVFFLMFPSHLP